MAVLEADMAVLVVVVVSYLLNRLVGWKLCRYSLDLASVTFGITYKCKDDVETRGFEEERDGELFRW